MRISKIEKVILSIVIALTLLSFYLAYEGVNRIEEAGGIKQVIINTGKEFKQIFDEINK